RIRCSWNIRRRFPTRSCCDGGQSQESEGNNDRAAPAQLFEVHRPLQRNSTSPLTLSPTLSDFSQPRLAFNPLEHFTDEPVAHAGREPAQEPDLEGSGARKGNHRTAAANGLDDTLDGVLQF